MWFDIPTHQDVEPLHWTEKVKLLLVQSAFDMTKLLKLVPFGAEQYFSRPKNTSWYTAVHSHGTTKWNVWLIIFKKCDKTISRFRVGQNVYLAPIFPEVVEALAAALVMSVAVLITEYVES